MGEITHRTDYQYLLDEKSCDTIRGFHVTSFASSFCSHHIVITPNGGIWTMNVRRFGKWETDNVKYKV